MVNMQNNTANQGQTLNNNEIDNKDKEFLEELKRDIENIKNNTGMSKNEKEEKISNYSYYISEVLPENAKLTPFINKTSEIINDNQAFASAIINGFTQGCEDKGKNFGHIGRYISQIIQTDGIKDDLDLVPNIIDGFTQGYFNKVETFQKISPRIFQIINTKGITDDLGLVFNIIYGFTQGCLNKEEKAENVGTYISKIIGFNLIEENSNLASRIIDGFTQGCIDKKQKAEDIGKGISQIINTKGIKDDLDLVFNIIRSFTQDCIIGRDSFEDIGKGISQIINTKGIKEKKDLVFNIINGFIQGCINERRDWENIGTGISQIIQTDGIKDEPDLVSNIINCFTQSCIFSEEDINKYISQIIQTDGIKDDSNLVINIIDGFIQGCIAKEENKNVATYISQIIQTDGIKNDPDLVSIIIYAFTQSCIDKDKILSDIGAIINADGIKNDPHSANLVSRIIDGFTGGCIAKGEDLKNITTYIPQIIQKVKITETDEIKDYQNLVSNIIDGFVKGCLAQKPNNIQEITESFFKLFNSDFVEKEKEKEIEIETETETDTEIEIEIKSKLKPIFSLIVSQHFMNTLTNSIDGQLSEEEKREAEEEVVERNNKRDEFVQARGYQGIQEITIEESLELQKEFKELSNLQNEYLTEKQNKEDTEKQLLNCYKKLFNDKDNEKINSFKDIPLEELSKSQEEYLEERFKKGGVDGGWKYETFLKMACNLIPKPEGNREPNVADLENNKNIFKDLKFIDLIDNDGIESKEKLFKAIGLQETDFGNKEGGFSIVYCSFLAHAFVMIIDKTKEWEKAKDPKTESIYLIDSSGFIKAVKDNPDLYPEHNPSLLKEKEEIFVSTPTLNQSYQQNGTCWLNAMSAVGFLLEEQQNGLTIGELLNGFNKKQVDESEKISELNTQLKGLSSFEQGICDYSTEHFYPLVNHSKEEKYFITKLLAEKVEENIKSQEKLKEMSEQLEKLKKMSKRLEEVKKQYKELTTNQQEMSKEEFDKKQNKKIIINKDYLQESFKHIVQNSDKLEKFCTKLSILDLNQGENSNNEKLGIYHFGDIANAEGNNYNSNYLLDSKQHKGKNRQQYRR